MRSLRVLLIGDYPPPSGGVATHVQQLEAYLTRAGTQVRVLNIGKGGPPPSAAHLVWTAGRYAAAGWIVHLHTSGNNPKSWMVVAALGLLAGASARRFVTLHSGSVPQFLSSAPRRRFARAGLSGYGQIIAVSAPIQRALIECGAPQWRVAVHPAFLASQTVAGAPPPGFAQARARFSPLVAYAHHPSPVYGRATLMRALDLLPSAAGVSCFGPGSQEIDHPRVASLGELEHAAALGVIAASDVLARPTTIDGDAITVREALALGTPAVASDAVLRPEGTRVFRTGDAASLAQAIARAAESGRVSVPTVDAGPFLLERYQRSATEGSAHAEPALRRA
jgi:glycogen(starch) synthase